MSYEDVMRGLTELKKEYGRLLTNIVPGAMNRDLKYELLKKDEGILVVAYEPYRKRGYFAAKDGEALKTLLKGLPKDIVFEWIYKDENILDDIMGSAGIERYATYFRRMIVMEENPYELPLKGRSAILQEMYEPDCGEYAREEDAQELWELSNSVFDVNCDDVFTVEEWKELIARREVLIYRADNKIISCYVWRLEGNKLYSNISINLGPANILYNLERRIFDEMWNKGIRIHYFWKNVENKKAIQREGRGGTPKRSDTIYNAIYKS